MILVEDKCVGILEVSWRNWVFLFFLFVGFDCMVLGCCEEYFYCRYLKRIVSGFWDLGMRGKVFEVFGCVEGESEREREKEIVFGLFVFWEVKRIW